MTSLPLWRGIATNVTPTSTEGCWSFVSKAIIDHLIEVMESMAKVIVKRQLSCSTT